MKITVTEEMKALLRRLEKLEHFLMYGDLSVRNRDILKEREQSLLAVLGAAARKEARGG